MIVPLLRFVLRARRLATLPRQGAGKMVAIQKARWRRLAAVRRGAVPFYRDRLQGLDLDRCGPADVPVLTKSEMMEHFDDLVTDRRIRRAGVEGFIADPRNLGPVLPWPIRRLPHLRQPGPAGRGRSGAPRRPAGERGPDRTRPGGAAGLASPGSSAAPLAAAPAGLPSSPRSLGFYPSGSAFAYLQAAGLPFMNSHVCPFSTRSRKQ